MPHAGHRGILQLVVSRVAPFPKRGETLRQEIGLQDFRRRDHAAPLPDMPGKGREIARRMALRLPRPQGIPEELVIGRHLVSRAVTRAAREPLIGIGHQRLFHLILRECLQRRVVEALALIERRAVEGTGQHDDFIRRNAGRRFSAMMRRI